MSDSGDNDNTFSEYKEATVRYLDVCIKKDYPTVVIGRCDGAFVVASNVVDTDNPVFQAIDYLVNSEELLNLLAAFARSNTPGDRVAEMVKEYMLTAIIKADESETVH